jgi:hypothetical protein
VFPVLNVTIDIHMFLTAMLEHYSPLFQATSMLVLRHVSSRCYSALLTTAENCAKVSDLCQFQDLSEVLLKVCISWRITRCRLVNCYRLFYGILLVCFHGRPRTTACWLIVPPALDVPTLANRCPAPTDAFRTLAA